MMMMNTSSTTYNMILVYVYVCLLLPFFLYHSSDMAQVLRRWFTRKPWNHLVEISDRVYVLDCCFSTEAWDEDEYKSYTRRVSRELEEYYPVGTSYLVVNLRQEAIMPTWNTSSNSIITEVLSEEKGMAVVEYPRLYENCPIIPLEILHHILIMIQNWVNSKDEQNVLLLLCERGGWPTLALMIAGLNLMKRKGEVKEVLDMAYGFALADDDEMELVRLMCALDPRPSQLRYLGYISVMMSQLTRDSLDDHNKMLIMDRLVLRGLSSDNQSPVVVRVYGRDSSSDARGTKMLFSSKQTDHVPAVGHYLEMEHLVEEVEIGTRVQGDIVVECSKNLKMMNQDHSREEMMFRVAFHTAFVHHSSNLLLLLKREEVDVLWDSDKHHQFPPHFEVDVLFSKIDVSLSNSTSSSASTTADTSINSLAQPLTQETTTANHDHSLRKFEKIPPPTPPPSPKSRKVAAAASVTPSPPPTPHPIEISQALIKSSQPESQLSTSPSLVSTMVFPLPPISFTNDASPSSLDHTTDITVYPEPPETQPNSGQLIVNATSTSDDDKQLEALTNHFLSSSIVNNASSPVISSQLQTINVGSDQQM